jgi:hypothetical protein
MRSALTRPGHWRSRWAAKVVNEDAGLDVALPDAVGEVGAHQLDAGAEWGLEPAGVGGCDVLRRTRWLGVFVGRRTEISIAPLFTERRASAGFSSRCGVPADASDEARLVDDANVLSRGDVARAARSSGDAPIAAASRLPTR